MSAWNFDPGYGWDPETGATWSSTKINMYGFTPCPRCGRGHRCEFNDKPGVVQCDDCGFEEPVVKKPETASL